MTNKFVLTVQIVAYKWDLPSTYELSFAYDR